MERTVRVEAIFGRLCQTIQTRVMESVVVLGRGRLEGTAPIISGPHVEI